jgi:aspyridone synthetase (hybrid polyketide synthase/nonribosomal peptide synthetase)
MNHQKFVEVKSRQEKQSGLGLTYRTGDRGYLQVDRTFVFIGHTDGGETMIKLRGLRIELDEVANAALRAVPAKTFGNVLWRL